MSWVKTELEAIDLGDHRLNCRSIAIVEGLGLSPGRTIPQAFQSKSEIKATYNFFSNGSVSDEKILTPHTEKTLERVQEYPTVLLVSDTSEIDFTSKKAMRNKERLSNKKSGLWLHSTIAVTPERLNLGVVEANFWSRSPEVCDDADKVRDKLPIEEKESFRWLQSYRVACEIARKAPETHIIHMTDREGDIVEVYAESADQMENGVSADFIIRSQHDRVIKAENSDDKKLKKKLRQKLKDSPSLGEIEFNIPPTEKRKGRKVKQELKAVRVKLNPKRKHKAKVKVNAVMAIEKNPPDGEEALMWVFITSLPVNTFEDVSNIIKHYLCRWEIELFFKVLKSGCKIEERQLRETKRMKALIAVFMILGWRVIFTMMLGRVCAQIPCNDLFEESEWKSVYKVLNKEKRLPRKPPSLGEFVVMIASLGGYVRQNSTEPPGVKVMWKGMSRMVDFSIAWEAFGRS